MKAAFHFLSLAATIVLSVRGVTAACSASAPIALCCLNVALFSTNAAVWGPICGFTNVTGNPLVGARCIPYNTTSGCPSGTIGTCCQGTIPGQCALGTYCGGSPSGVGSTSLTPTSTTSGSTSSTTSTTSATTTTSTTTTSTTTTSTTATTTTPASTTTTVSATSTSTSVPSSTPSPLPDGWYTAAPCAILNSWSNLTVTWWWGLNTPSACAKYCSTSPGGDIPSYTVAGVAYGDQCHCGYSYSHLLGTRAYQEECDVPCAGDKTQMCGRWDRIQVYSSVPREKPFFGPPGTTPWREVHECAVDTVDRVFANVTVTSPVENTPAVCAKYCESLGPEYLYGGVENGGECHCGTGWRNGVEPTPAPYYECDKKCVGHGTFPCGGAWRISTFTRA